VSEQDAAIGDQFGKMEIRVGAALNGIKKAAAEPILQFLSDHSQEVSQVVAQTAEAIKTAIPVALQAVVLGAQVAIPVLQLLIETLKDLAIVSDAVGLTQNATPALDRLQGGVGKLGAAVEGIKVDQLNVHIDPRESSGQIAAKILPQLDDAQRQYVQQTIGSARLQLVADGVGGRARG
jgi:hypothetical protein